MMFGAPQILLMLGIAMLVAFASTFFPVYKFAKKNPIDSINNKAKKLFFITLPPLLLTKLLYQIF